MRGVLSDPFASPSVPFSVSESFRVPMMVFLRGTIKWVCFLTRLGCCPMVELRLHVLTIMIMASRSRQPYTVKPHYNESQGNGISFVIACFVILGFCPIYLNKSEEKSLCNDLYYIKKQSNKNKQRGPGLLGFLS